MEKADILFLISKLWQRQTMTSVVNVADMWSSNHNNTELAFVENNYTSILPSMYIHFAISLTTWILLVAIEALW